MNCPQHGAMPAHEKWTEYAASSLEHHDVKSTDHYTAHYPDRDTHGRQETAAYRCTHKYLVETVGLGCYIGNSDCSHDPLETHHFFVEWAASGGVDWDRFGVAAKYLTNPQTGQSLCAIFSWSNVAKDPSIFVDSPANMVVLCSTHHRDEQKGIHHVPFPVWILQRFQSSDFFFLAAPVDDHYGDDTVYPADNPPDLA
jgi:hypothetical protein